MHCRCMHLIIMFYIVLNCAWCLSDAPGILKLWMMYHQLFCSWIPLLSHMLSSCRLCLSLFVLNDFLPTNLLQLILLNSCDIFSCILHWTVRTFISCSYTWDTRLERASSLNHRTLHLSKNLKYTRTWCTNLDHLCLLTKTTFSML